jgi:four helix bundle protein
LKVENGKWKMEYKENNIVMNKSYAFALRIIKLYKYLISDHKEYVLSKQILRCGTSIGALVKEAEHAQSKPDFLNKMNVALKEANETEYWLMLLKDSNFIDEKSFISIQNDCIELIRLLASIVKSSKETLKKIK